jgi:Carboxypeptidase regulatory-like domain
MIRSIVRWLAPRALRAAHSDFNREVKTDSSGAFSFPAIPLGDYNVTVAQTGFSEAAQTFTLASNTSPMLHIELQVGDVKRTVDVTSSIGLANVDSATLVSRQDIENTPGGDRIKCDADDYGVCTGRLYNA